MSHSPGPWRWGRFGVVDVNGETVAAGSTAEDIDVPNPADAALIATCPRMLELLRTMTETADQNCGYCDSDNHADCPLGQLLSELEKAGV